MGERACVQPLNEVFEVGGTGFREVEGQRAGFGEGVGLGEGGGKERGDGAEGFKVDVEGAFVGADGDGNDGLEEGACWVLGGPVG